MFSPYRPKPIAFQLKKLSAAVAMAMLFSQAHAAGWGDLTVLSSLGQPLRADIELVSVAAQDDGPLTVKLASVDAYRRANIEFNPVLMSLRFAVEQRGGLQFVRVTSTQPVNEPFVDMLLELSSSSGRVVREYVFLLDPATTEAAQMVAAAPIASPAPASKPAAQPQRAPSQQAAPKPSASKPAAAPTASAKPRLTLTGVTAVSATDNKAGVIALEDYATMEKQVADANARVLALEQKINDLQKLLETTNTLLADLQKQNEAATTLAKPPQQTETPAALPAAALVAETKPAAQEQPATAVPAKPAPALPQPAAPTSATQPPAEETDYLIPGAALLAALLGAAGIYTSRRRKSKQAAEPGIRGDAHADKTATGAGDTATAALSTGLLLPTGIGHTHEVDPLAEADVYIAYGRDVQAEDILKEALARQPDRHPVRVKLLSIYAGRKDLQSFDALASELHRMTKGEGEDWQQAAELGREIAPANPLYAVQAEPEPEPELVLERVEDEPPSAPLPGLVPTEEISPVALEAAPGEVDFDLDNLAAQAEPLPAIPQIAGEVPGSGPGPIDFDLIKPAPQEEEDLAPIPELPVVALDESSEDGNLMDFDFLQSGAKAEAVPELPQAVLETVKAEDALLDFDFLKPAAEKSEDGAKR